MKSSIILIDDDHGPMDYYVEALKDRGFAVRQIDSVDEAFRWIEASDTQPPDLFVLDLMMPPGTRLTLEATEGGRRSGLFVLEAIRKRFSAVPVVVLTNRNDSDVAVAIPEGIPYNAKFEVAPFSFADFVKEEVLKVQS